MENDATDVGGEEGMMNSAVRHSEFVSEFLIYAAFAERYMKPAARHSER